MPSKYVTPVKSVFELTAAILRQELPQMNLCCPPALSLSYCTGAKLRYCKWLLNTLNTHREK